MYFSSRCTHRNFRHRLTNLARLLTVLACLLATSNFTSTLSILRIRRVASTDWQGEEQGQIVGGGSNTAATETLEDQGGASSASSTLLASLKNSQQKNKKRERLGTRDGGELTRPRVDWWQSLKKDGGANAIGTATATASNVGAGRRDDDDDDDKDDDDDVDNDDDGTRPSEGESVALRPPPPPPPPDLTEGAEVPPPIVIAYVITITRCDPNEPVKDGAAVLAHSVRRHFRPPPTGGDAPGDKSSSRSRYGAKFYAIIHPNASTCANKLSRLGYEVLVRSPAAAVTKAEWSEEERWRRTGGEYVKLHAFTLVEHPLAVLLDVTSIVLRPFDELFDAMLLPPRGKGGGGNDTVAREEGGVVHVAPAGTKGGRSNVVWEREYIDSFITADSTSETGMLHEDGLVVVRPSMDEFYAMRSGLESGIYDRADWGALHLLRGTSFDDDRSSNTAIESSSTLKGLLSRHYRLKNGGGRGSNIAELNRCVYNVASDVVQIRNKSSACDQNGVEDGCSVTNCRSIVKRFRATMRTFTFSAGVCHKPWRCSGHEVRHSLRDPTVTELSLCQQMTHTWFRFRQELEDIWAQNLEDISDNGRYVYKPPYRLGTYEAYEFLGNCLEQGSEGYVPMQLP